MGKTVREMTKSINRTINEAPQCHACVCKIKSGVTSAVFVFALVAATTYGRGVIVLTNALASIAGRPLSSLVVSSDLICSGTIRSAELSGDGGIAQVAVGPVYKGRIPTTTLSLRWTREPEDQRLDRVGAEWLMFLRRQPDGSYAATHFGCSYLAVTYDMDTEEKTVLLLERTAEVQLDLPLKTGKTRALCEVCRPGERWVDVPSVALRELVNAIRTKSASRTGQNP